MKFWVINHNGGYASVMADHRPKKAVCLAPQGFEPGDDEFLIVSDITINGVQSKQAQLNTVAKNAAKQAKAAAELAEASDYRKKRRAAYPSIGDQLDAIYKKEELGDDSDWQAIAAQITAVKAQFPKPE